MAVRPHPRLSAGTIRDFLTWRHSVPPRPLLTILLSLGVLIVLWDAVHIARPYFATSRSTYYAPTAELAPLFTPEVSYWGPQIVAWATIYDVDPNLLATVMQIESCGHPTISSPAGAQGLFQVMPMHFAYGEVMTNPDTNAKRGAGVLRDCMRWANDDPGYAMACYNGGPSVVNKPQSSWYNEVQSYYYWGTGIYADAIAGKAESERLTEWLDAGGSRLCARAAAVASTG